MHIDGISPEDIVSLEIPTGEPIHYSYEEGVISRDA
jgi:bisphosphoglycerate-dependent phosphoglycerate mutase